MIGQYLSNTNEIAILSILQKKLGTKQDHNSIAASTYLFF
jgi:hypothetical protein